jgi:hypothetical protein
MTMAPLTGMTAAVLRGAAETILLGVDMKSRPSLSCAA